MASVTSTLSTTQSSALGTTHLNSTIGGIDVDALVSATIQADSIPVTLLQNKNYVLQAQLNDLTTIKTSMFSLNNALKDLTYSSAYTGRTATSTDSTIVTATAKNGSSNGSFVIDVTALATTTHASGTALSFSAGISGTGTKATVTGSGTSLVTTTNRNLAFNDPSSSFTVAAGSFTINGQTINVAADDTVNTVLNKISASSAGVTATIDDSGNVVLTQKTAGASSVISVGPDSSGFLAAVGMDSTTSVPGTDAAETLALNTSLGAGAVTAGYFSINGTYFSVDPTKDSIDSIVNKINSSTTAGVLAFYDSTTGKISLSNQTAGAKDIVLGTSDGTGSDSSNFLATVGLTAAAVTQGTDAAVTVNGVAVTPVNNQVTLNGNVFTINGEGKATVTVQNDTASIITKIQNFIELYNTTMDQVNAKLSEKPDSSSNDPSVGDLFGDSTLRDIAQTLRSFSYATVTSQPATMQQLSQVGITTGAIGQSVEDSKTGHLTLDVDKLTAALNADPMAVASLFGNSTMAVNAESLTGTAGSDGTTTTFQLKNSSISSPALHIYTAVTGGTDVTANYKQVSAFSGTETEKEKQYIIDYTTGKVTFYKAPDAGYKITADYTYDVSQGSNAGIFVQMSTLLNGYSNVGGTFDAIIGSDGSITNQLSYNKDRIKDLQERISNEQAALYTKYQNMQSILQTIQSQGSFLTAQFAALSSSSSSSSS